MVHVEETTSHRRFAGFFIRNAEHAQRVFNTIRAAPLPVASRKTQGTVAGAPTGQVAGAGAAGPAGAGAGAAGAGGAPKTAAWAPKRRTGVTA